MKFDMSEAWQEAMAMIAANREVLLIVAGIFFFLPTMALTFAIGDTQPITMSEDTAAMEQAVANFYGNVGWMMGLVFLVQLAGYIALLALLRDAAKPTVGDAIKTGLIGMLPAFAAYIIITVGLGLLFGILLGIAMATGVMALVSVIAILAFVGCAYILVKTALVPPVIAIEKTFNPIRAIRRSWQLTKGNSVRLAMFFVLISLVYLVVSVLVGLVVSALGFVLGSSAEIVVSGLLSGLIGAIAAVVFVAVLAAIHRQLAGPSSAAIGRTFD